jgi:hypothetical protein
MTLKIPSTDEIFDVGQAKYTTALTVQLVSIVIVPGESIFYIQNTILRS